MAQLKGAIHPKIKTQPFLFIPMPKLSKIALLHHSKTTLQVWDHEIIV